MLSLIVRQSPWDDDVALRAAWEAAKRLKDEYSLRVLVEVVNETLGYSPFRDGPTVSVGPHEIPVDPAMANVEELIDRIVQAVLEVAGLTTSKEELKVRVNLIDAIPLNPPLIAA
ncbi:MAG: hypothetical protein JCHSAcid_13660 [uncultured Acidilobus sp. JCHS]|jgi:hypothetical protein|nr:MAG: hypothetical protein JCHSAcid_13660 [uncultured Acidilobus sp. JCHS]